MAKGGVAKGRRGRGNQVRWKSILSDTLGGGGGGGGDTPGEDIGVLLKYSDSCLATR
jgi:hypothetical protein